MLSKPSTIVISMSVIVALLIVIGFGPVGVPQTHIVSGGTTLIGKGSVLSITSSSQKIASGLPAEPSYYAGHISFVVDSDVNVMGNWTSTMNSVIWVTGTSRLYMEDPVPDARTGQLNFSLGPGDYVLIYGGFPGDVISISQSIKLVPLNVQSISSLSIEKGTVINATGGSVAYKFSISEPGTLIGSFDTTCPFNFAVYSNTSGGFSFGSYGTGPYSSGTLNSPLQAGTYQLTFGESVFNITGTIEVINFNQS